MKGSKDADFRLVFFKETRNCHQVRLRVPKKPKLPLL